jgi:hypothetical protein
MLESLENFPWPHKRIRECNGYNTKRNNDTFIFDNTNPSQELMHSKSKKKIKNNFVSNYIKQYTQASLNHLINLIVRIHF